MPEDQKSSFSEAVETGASAAHTICGAIKTGKAISSAAKGAAAGGPYGAVAGAVWAGRKHIGKIIVAVIALLMLPVLFVLMLPGLIFGGLTNAFSPSDPEIPILNSETAIMEIIHTIIHPIFTLAVRDNYIRINPATGAMAEIKKSHNWEKPKRHALTIAEQTAFIDYMRNHKVYNHWLPLFTVLLGTGCRIGEAIGLRWEDCDFDEGIISINHNMVYRKYEEDEKARFHIVTPKTSAGVRIVPMLSEVKAALQAEWETQKIVGFNESIVDGYTGLIFQNRYGDPLSPHSVNRAIDRICAAYIEDETVLADQEGRDPVLIRHFSAHNLRHTFCTRFCENERNIKVIQEIMGHADIETTMNIYAEATKEKKKESFSNLEGKIKIS